MSTSDKIIDNDSTAAAQRRIEELEMMLYQKELEFSEAKLKRYQELQNDEFNKRLEAARSRKRERSVHMDVWTCDDVAVWLQEIQLSEYSNFMLSQSVDGNLLLSLGEDCWADMGLHTEAQVQILRENILPYRARYARKTWYLGTGDYGGLVAMDSLKDEGDEGLCAEFMREAIGVERVTATSSALHSNKSVTLGYGQDSIESSLCCSIECHVAGQRQKQEQGSRLVVAGYSVLFLGDHSCLRDLSWVLLGGTPTHSSSSSPGGLTPLCQATLAVSEILLSVDSSSQDQNRIPRLETDHDCRASCYNWDLLHRVEGRSFSSVHGCGYYDLRNINDIRSSLNSFKIFKILFSRGFTNLNVRELDVDNIKLHVYASSSS